MDTKLISIFLEVLESGSFASAARNLDQDPSKISRSIAILEKDLGIRLFQRTTRHIALTEAGKQFATRVTPLLNELDQLQEDLLSAKSQPRGNLRISASSAFGQVCLLPHLTEFRERFPAIKLELVFDDRNVDLVAENIDLALRLGPSIDADVIATKIMQTRYHVCASPDYLEANPSLQHPSDLETHSPICFTLNDYQTQWLFRDDKKRVSQISITPAFTVSNALAVREAATLGQGPALLANWLIQEDLQNGRLVKVFSEFEVTATNFDTGAWILYPSREYLPRKTRVTIDFIKEKLT